MTYDDWCCDISKRCCLLRDVKYHDSLESASLFLYSLLLTD